MISNGIHVAPGGDRLSVREDGAVSRISVFDVATRTERSIYEAPASQRIVDVKWMEDGKSLLFFTRARSASQQSATETLYRIAVEGGAPEQLLEVPNRSDSSHWLRVRPDNRQILYTVVNERLELWALDNYPLQ